MISPFSQGDHNWIENRKSDGQIGAVSPTETEWVQDRRRCIFSDAEKARLERRGAPVALPRRRPSRRSSPRRWLLIFELVQNFHNTATAADARVRRVRWRGRRAGRRRDEQTRKEG